MTASQNSPPPRSESDRSSRLRKALEGATIQELAAASYLWEFEARPEQLVPPGDWRVWLILAGRGFGKTRSGAGYIQRYAEAHPGARIALVAATAADVRDTMVEGESGIIEKAPPWARPKYEPSKRRLTWPNGTMATTYSAEEPNQLRGPQHHQAWADELAAWRFEDTWDQLQFGLRLGADPRVVVTTTPRPTPIVRSLIKSSTTFVTRGSTFDNRANLPAAFFEKIVAKYEGTRLGRQELYAEVLDDAPGALWKRDQIDAGRVRDPKSVPHLRTVVVAVDIAVTSTDKSDETGIIVFGVGDDGHGYALEDASGKYSPNEWAQKVFALTDAHKADRIVAETNQGGDLVENNLRTVRRAFKFEGVHASRGKRTRAEPVAALYEQGRIHHVGSLPTLEDQMCSWEADAGGPSPDRMDALVWAATSTMVDGNPNAGPLLKPSPRPSAYRFNGAGRGFG